MPVRRWQVPIAVAAIAASRTATSVLEAERNRDLAARLPVNADTLLAIVADAQARGEGDQVAYWAEQIYRQSASAEDARVTQVLLAAGFDESGCTPDAYGVLDPEYDGSRICAVVRASAGGWERWTDDGWIDALEPVGMPYATLRGDALADALDAISAGASLLLRPTQPRAFVTAKQPIILVAAADAAQPDPATSSGAQVFAITDQFDTTAVVTLFQVAPGPVISVRKGGAWAPDDGTMLGQLTGLQPPPVIAIPPDQVASVIRQTDDYDTTHPQTAKGPSGSPTPLPSAVTPAPVAASADHSTHVMVALPVDPDTAAKLAVPDGENPADMHVTLVYLGDIANLPNQQTLHRVMQGWADEVQQPIEGVVSGPATFEANQDAPVHVALVDAPDLPGQRQDLVDRLADIGITADTEHGFTPHITRKYDTAPSEVESPPAGHPLHFDRAHLHYGDQITPFPFGQGQPLAAAATEHDRRVRQAKDADSEFDAQRAIADLDEQNKRRQFEITIKGRHSAMVSEGIDPDDAAGAVAREIAAEDARRELWEKDRADALIAEKARRLLQHPDLRLSAELTDRTGEHGDGDDGVLPVVAVAVPHTAMPHALLDYWTHGDGAAKIRWGEPSDFYRCRRELARYLHPGQINGACNELHKIATGMWTSEHAKLEGKK